MEADSANIHSQTYTRQAAGNAQRALNISISTPFFKLPSSDGPSYIRIYNRIPLFPE